MGSVGLAYQRFKAGSNAAFSQGLGDQGGMGQDGNQYPGGPEDTGYNDPPFQGGGEQPGELYRFKLWSWLSCVSENYSLPCRKL